MAGLIFLIILSTLLHAFNIDETVEFNELLSHTEVYIDNNKSLSLKEVAHKTFQKNHKEILGFGYSPDFNVWIKFELTNSSTKTIQKIIEYDNPLASNIQFFESTKNNTFIQEGLFYISKKRDSVNPIFRITLHPQESKTFFIKASSHITTLIVKLNLWTEQAFHKKEILYQVILAMFFGAMGIIIFYNLVVYFSTRELSYLYYVLFFVGITIHHALYKGFMQLYLLPTDSIPYVMQFSSVIVAIPTLFLALFTKSILNVKQYPLINQLLNYYLVLFPILIAISLYNNRNIFSVILLIFLFLITFYAVLKKNRQAYFIIFGWFLFLTSGIFMYLSSLGIYNIFSIYPFYTEVSLAMESLIFSLSLSDKIKQLNKEKVSLQNHLIAYQQDEQKRLSEIIKKRTYDLEQSLHEKELLLQELNHRVKNSMQTIVSFLRLKMDEVKDVKLLEILNNIENRIMAINHLYSLLHTSSNISYVSAFEYFTFLLDDIEASYQSPNIDITLKTDVQLKSESAIYCGFILNEAVTNSFQHAFNGSKKGLISISLCKNHKEYELYIKDNGVGYKDNISSDSLGITIMETLVITQLRGSLSIESSNGVEIKIVWKDNE